ncbi:hypothetical protein [Nonlabens tegetincola]|uniref:hypothetical protein n=1 Tax=Nonlabens tegetincola TaxID=323273 RepID=UPI0030C7B5E6
MIRSIIFVITVLSINCVLGQSRTSSPYSFFGLGQQTFKGTIENRSMGGLRTHLDSIHTTLNNPATYGKIKLINYGVGLLHTETWASTESENDTYDSTSLEYLNVSIPLGNNAKTGIGFGLVPFKSVGYTIGDLTDTEYYNFTGEGSITRAYFGVGHELTKNLSIGAELRYNFGQETNSSSVLTNQVQFGSNETNETDFSGLSYNLALHYEKNIGDEHSLQASIVYSPESKLVAKSTSVLANFSFTPGTGESLFNARDPEENEEDLTLPSELTVGLNYGKLRSWMIGGEFSMRGESSLSNRSFSPNNSSFKDAISLRAGGYYIPNFNSLTSYWQRVTYRFGARFEETGLVLNNEDINEFGISFGMGLPIGGNRSFSNANIGLELGQRGTENAGLIKETFASLSISLSLNDRWFIKRKYN